MHCLEIPSPKIVLLYQLPETELMWVKTVMDSNRQFSFLTLRRVILIIPIILLILSYSFYLSVLTLFVLGYTTPPWLTDTIHSHLVTQSCHVLYCRKRSSVTHMNRQLCFHSNIWEYAKSLCLPKGVSAVWGSVYLHLPTTIVRWR